jgi:tRNA threonylcarbamoyladenosine biosynthesis protein TsaE
MNPPAGPSLPAGVHETRSPEETEALAERLAACLRPGDRVLLSGPLGSGKTTFVRGLARGLGLDPAEVHSPTFTFVHRYRGAARLVHADLYRIESAEAYQELGLEGEEEAGSIFVIEWAERLPAHLPGPQVRVEFEISGEASRRLRISAS